VVEARASQYPIIIINTNNYGSSLEALQLIIIESRAFFVKSILIIIEARASIRIVIMVEARASQYPLIIINTNNNGSSLEALQLIIIEARASQLIIIEDRA